MNFRVIRPLLFAMLGGLLMATGCVQWTTNYEGNLHSVGAMGVPVWTGTDDDVFRVVATQPVTDGASAQPTAVATAPKAVGVPQKSAN